MNSPQPRSTTWPRPSSAYGGSGLQTAAANEGPDRSFAQAMLGALRCSPRRMAPKFFYDARGSQLFDAICEQPEYYVTRTELAILEQHAREIAAFAGPEADIVEFGAGSIAKARLLLDALPSPRRFVPIDISASHLSESAAALQVAYPDLRVEPLAADYTRAFRLPPPLTSGGQRIGLFLGSSLGNFDAADVQRFLRTAGSMLRGGALLVGIDLVKDPAVLHAAYNDAAGVTAAFNLNLLERANRELDADFDTARFAHYAFYVPPARRVEMHLVSSERQVVRVCGQVFEFAEGESLHTENSHKFTLAGFRVLAARSGLRPGPAWLDARRWFALQWLHCEGGALRS